MEHIVRAHAQPGRCSQVRDPFFKAPHVEYDIITYIFIFYNSKKIIINMTCSIKPNRPRMREVLIKMDHELESIVPVARVPERYVPL